MTNRSVSKSRKTKETDIQIRLNLDGSGQYEINTGIPFFDHMLAQLARHGQMDLNIRAKGDLEIDGHHTVEDVGWVLGQALYEALGDRRGITRFGHAFVRWMKPHSSRRGPLGSAVPGLQGGVKVPRIGDLQAELIEEFLKAFVQEGKFNLHVENLYGRNQHHIAETIFKGTARALRMATRVDADSSEIPSTKGVL
jgi:imidazoleglycerol-phosphate dehydratase